MDLLKGELGSSEETRVTSTLDGNEVIGIEAERVSGISEVADEETTIPAIKTEPNESCAPVVQMASAASLSYQRREDKCSNQSIKTCEPRSLNDLPDEILLKIYSHFGPEDLCFTVAKVCKKWYNLAKDIVLWKNLSYYCDDSSDISRIAEVLTVAPALHSLIIHERDDAADILEFQFRNHCDLRKLILEDCLLGEDSTGLLTNIVALYPDLEGLSLQRSRPITSACHCLIPRLKKLSELNLSSCEGLNGETVRLIADSCRHLKKLNLDLVTLDDVTLDDDDVIYVIDRLGKQLTTLVLDWPILTDVAYSYLKNCARLQELTVSYCDNMTDRGLLEGIGSLHELTSLRLCSNDILTAQGLSTFLHRISISSIVLLELSSCSNVDDEVLKGIAERCIHLEVLTVGGECKVTDAGISVVIIHCSKLRTLNLIDLPSITGNGYLTLLPSHLPHLRQMGLTHCDNVCDKYVAELVASAPELVVINCQGGSVGAMSKKPLDSYFVKGSCNCGHPKIYQKTVI